MERFLTKPRLLVGLSVVVFISAWNRELYLLYAMFALLVSTTLVGYASPRFALRGLSAMRSHPLALREGDLLTVKVLLKNTAWVSRRMVEVEDSVPLAEPGRQHPLSFIGHIGARNKRQFSYDLPCDLRGEHILGPLTLRSGFPLGLWIQARQLPETVSRILVYPRTFAVAAFPLTASGQVPLRGINTVPKTGGSEDFFGTREYRSGDSPRFIHWRSTARHGELIVKEFETRAATEVNVVLDLDGQAHYGIGKQNTFEYAVKIGASISEHALKQGHDVQLFAYGKQVWSVDAGRGTAQWQRLLEAFARMKADGVLRYPDAIRRAAHGMRDGSSAVLFISDPPRDPLGVLQAIAVLRAHRVRPIGIFLDRGSFSGGSNTARHHSSSGPVDLLSWFRIQGLPVYHICQGDSLEQVFTRK